MTPIEAIQGNLASLNENAAKAAEDIAEIRSAVGRVEDALQEVKSLVGNFVKETEKLRVDARRLVANGIR